MVRIAIVEDDKASRREMEAFLRRYETSHHCTFRVSTFSSGEEFLSNYANGYDLVFMDIQMPGLNGMDTARSLRQLDEQVMLIFITSLTQYAIAGYEVGALYYLVKPLQYHEFALKLTTALHRIHPSGNTLLLHCGQNILRINMSSIRYLERVGHNVVYHTDMQAISRRCSLRYAESELDNRFARCSSSFIVNMDQINTLHGDEVDVGGTVLRISRPQRQAFLQAVSNRREDRNV